MTKPVSNPTWDSNGTNCASDTTAGHKTDGYALNEVPTSTELNRQFKNAGEWIAWLSAAFDALTAARWEWRPAIGTSDSGLGAAGTFAYSGGGSMSFEFDSGGTGLFLPVPVSEGDHIVDFAFTFKHVGGGSVATAYLLKNDDTGTTTIVKQMPITSPSSSWTKYTTTSGIDAFYRGAIDLTVGADESYMFFIESRGLDRMQSYGVKVSRPILP